MQEADARRPELGRTARVVNIIAFAARRPAARPSAWSRTTIRGPRRRARPTMGWGGDRCWKRRALFAGRSDRQWSLLVLLTDGEEAGLMGAAALVTDRDVMRPPVGLPAGRVDRLGRHRRCSSKPARETLAGRCRGRAAPRTRAADPSRSRSTSGCRTTPTSRFSSGTTIPGLNFAPVGDSYAYHTARDTPERLSTATIRDTGENVVAILNALNATDITQRSSGSAAPSSTSPADSRLVYGPGRRRSSSIGALAARRRSPGCA